MNPPDARVEASVQRIFHRKVTSSGTAGSGDSKPVTVRPASARWSVRAVRKIVSPSGIQGSWLQAPGS